MKNILIVILLGLLVFQDYQKKTDPFEDNKVYLTKHGYCLGWVDGVHYALTNSWPVAESGNIDINPEYLRNQENIAWELRLREFN